MRVKYRFMQVVNLFRSLSDDNSPQKWIFIYGLPRSGTTFLLQQIQSISKRAIGDWELGEFADAINGAKERTYVKLNSEQLVQDLRRNLLANASPGGGTEYDIIVKQISTSKEHLDFMEEMLGAPPALKVFMFREPNGWLQSALEKFGINEAEALEVYRKGLESYEQMGGHIVEYNNDMTASIKQIPELADVNVDDFKIKRTSTVQAPHEFYACYERFLASKLHAEPVQ